MDMKAQVLEYMSAQGQDDIEFYLPTGSTLLNLACANDINGGYIPGSVVNVIGDSASGKTLLCLTALAELCHDDRLKDYIPIYDDVEAALAFNMEHMFGKELVGRLRPPAYHTKNPDALTDTIQQFMFNVLEWVEHGKPFIYILDSFDALTSDEEISKIDEELEADRDDKEVSGSYDLTKPKQASRMFRRVVRDMKRTKSVVVIVSQTRDNITARFNKVTRSGGRALRFYSSHEIWLANMGDLKSHDLVIGNNVRAKIDKNKATGRRREVEFTTYYSYGVDDIGAMIDFLVACAWWSKEKQSIVASEFDLKCSKAKLISHVEENGLEQDLRDITGEAWLRREEVVELSRKGKYT